MKTILSTNPTFTPGAANTGTLNFSSVNGFNIAGLMAVLNQTRGTLLYATGQASTGYFNWNNSTKVLTLKVDTSSHSSGDQLQVIYDGPGSSDPALTTVISGGVTDSIVTSSPAILLAYTPAGITTGSTTTGYEYLYQFTIKNGNTAIISGIANASYAISTTTTIEGGFDCPNGIKVSTSARYSNDNALGLTNARLSIHYILK
jgi:hypothetical protein